jgi:hypothetical protein
MINVLQKARDQVTKYCREQKLKCNLSRIKIFVFKKAGKLKKDERWTVKDPKIEVLDEINYLGVTFESSGGWKDKSSRQQQKGIRL